MTDPSLLAALAQALESDPRNGPLWLHYADMLVAAGRRDDALAALRTAVEIAPAREAALKKLVPLLRESGMLAEALIRAESWLESHDDAVMRAELARIHAARGSDPKPPAAEPDRAPSKPAARAKPARTADDEGLAVLSNAPAPGDEVSGLRNSTGATCA
jgi:tetratricopeptide (TPR) repeat protein